ncbi:MAG TPA: MFS transporter [Clostridia bacterium]|nr:MFS transporter [Clostridia bacterium]
MHQLIKSKNLFILSIILFIWAMCEAMTRPYLPIYVTELGGNMLAFGFMNSLSTAITIIFPLIVGIISDKKGRKKVLIWCTALEVLSILIIVLSNNWIQLIPGFIILNFATIVRKTPQSALIVSETQEEYRGAVFGSLNSIQGIGKIIGPLISAIIVVGLSTKLTFGIRGVLLVIILLLTTRIFEEEQQNVKFSRTTIFNTISKSFTKNSDVRKTLAPLAALLVAEVMISFFNGIFSPFLSVYVKTKLNSTASLGFFYAIMQVSFILTSWIAGSMTDKIGRKKMLIGNGITSLLVSLVLLAAAVQWHFIVAFILWGVMLGLGIPAFEAIVGDAVPKNKCGQVYGIFTALTTFAVVPAPLIGGFIIDRAGYDIPIILAAIGGILYAVIVSLFLKEAKVKSDKDSKIEIMS